MGIALTFDDGPHPKWTPRVLDVLDRWHVRATFFVQADNVARWPALVAETQSRGHQIGAHCFAHRSHLSMTGGGDRTRHRAVARDARRHRHPTVVVASTRARLPPVRPCLRQHRPERCDPASAGRRPRCSRPSICAESLLSPARATHNAWRDTPCSPVPPSGTKAYRPE